MTFDYTSIYTDPITSTFCRVVNIRFAVICILAFFIFSSTGFCQETPLITNYSLDTYKAHNQNWSISQSSDRFIYTANSDGLLEFDGSSWKLYPFPDGQIVRSVLCDNAKPANLKSSSNDLIGQKRIYVGGYGEFGYWENLPTGKLRYVSLSKNRGLASLKTEEIWNILKTPQYIYFQSFARIYRYDGKHIVEIRATDNQNFMFLNYVNGRLLIQKIGKGLYELKGTSFVELPGTRELSSATVTSILPYGQKALITTGKKGVFILDDNQLTSWSTPLSGELTRNVINKALYLNKRNLYVFGTIKNGIYITDHEGQLIYRINNENGLQNNTILSFTKDQEDNLWAGLDNGIDLIKLSAPVLTYQAADNRLGTTYTAALWNGNLYVGSNNGVFFKKWNSSEKFVPIAGLEGQTWNLTVSKGELICGHNDGTYRIDQNGAHKISNVNGGWVLFPAKSGSDTILLQASYNGLHIYRKKENQKWTYAGAVKGIPTIPIRQLARDKSGAVWMAHAYKGLFRARLNTSLDSTIYWKEYESGKELPSQFSVEINSVEQNVYVRSANRFFDADTNGNLTPSKRFPMEAEFYKIREGVNGEWFRVFNNRIEHHRPNFFNQVLNVSLVRNNENIVSLDDHFYFLCLDDGYALYDKTKADTPNLSKAGSLIRRITNLQNSGEDFGIINGVTLPYKARSIRIFFSTPQFGNNIHYKYRLRGLSSQWSDWTELNFADFTNLQGGSYTFEVINTLNETPTVFEFHVAPYWYETVLAKIIFIILGCFLLAGLIFYQEKRLARHKKNLLEEQEEKLRQQRIASEKKIMEMQNENLQKEIKNKSQQISNVAINVVRKNEILEEIRDELKQVKEEMGQQLPNIHYNKLLNSIEKNVAGKEDWVLFEENFNEIHDEFFTRLRSTCPSVTPSELRLAACLRMNLSTKEMAPALGISARGVEIKRYRLRKKLGLDADSNLVQYMMDI